VNNFAEIILVYRYKKVNYYSVSINDENSLFRQFVEKHSVTNKEKLNHIIRWIKIIGNKYGAKENYFRNEAETSDTSALPPKGQNREPVYVELNELESKQKTRNNLRLYCFRVNEKVVFLFNGDVKTTNKAQDCPSVKPHFKLANKITKLISEALREKEIKWNKNYTDIIVDNDFYLIW